MANLLWRGRFDSWSDVLAITFPFVLLAISAWLAAVSLAIAPTIRLFGLEF